MSQQYPDTLSIVKELAIQVVPDSSSLTVVVRGDSLVTGREAFKKAKELRVLVTELQATGIGEDRVSLENVSMETKAGRFLNSSEVSYTVRISAIALDALSQVLSVLARQKNLSLDCLEWSYPELEEQKDRLYQQAAVQAKEQAFRLAGSLGISVAGIYEMVPVWDYPQLTTDLGVPTGKRMAKAAVRAREPEELSLELGHHDTLKLTLKCRFRLGCFSGQG